MSRYSALARGRVMADEAMIDTVTFSYRTGNFVQDETTGRDVPEMVTRFTSKCKLSVGALGSLTPTAKDDPAAGRVTTELRLIMFLPVTAPPIKPDDTATIIAVGEDSDPQLLGRKLRVVAPIGQTYATARRFSVEEQLA